MKRFLNTLFVTTQGAWLARERENVLVRVEQETRFRMPIHNLGSIVAFGQVSASAPLMGLCAERGVPISFFTEQGKFLARVEGPVSGNVLLRRHQHRRSDDPEQAAPLASTFVAAKIANSRFVLQRAFRERRDDRGCAFLEDTIGHLDSLLRQVRVDGIGLDSVRGYEGIAAKRYFEAFPYLIRKEDAAFTFNGRSRRPPRDPVNAMLSFVYALLRHDIESALEGVGLDTAMGFLHRDRPGRPSLALDLMEELRAPLADRLVVALINRGQIKPSGFVRTESGAVNMDETTRKTTLVAWQERKRQTIRHPYLEETVEIGLIPHLQARLLAAHLRGDLDAYPAFVWK